MLIPFVTPLSSVMYLDPTLVTSVVDDKTHGGGNEGVAIVFMNAATEFTKVVGTPEEVARKINDALLSAP